MTPSGSSAASGTSANGRVCIQCGQAITTGRRDKKLCGQECQKAAARARAAAWHLEHGQRADVLARKAEASRRNHEAVQADPVRKEAQRLRTARWREANPDRLRETERRWRTENAELVREKNRRRRARLVDAYVSPIDLNSIWDRDNGLCGVCGDDIDLSLAWPHRLSVTVDHVVALANGGTHEPDNVQLAHAACNSRKGARAA